MDNVWPGNRPTGDSPHFFPPTQTVTLSLKKTQPPALKEKTMQYKTIVLGLLEERPQMYEQLRQERKLLATLEIYAKEFRSSHQAWKEQLLQTRPDSDPSQIASEALEIALKELKDRLPPESPNESEALSLDETMAYIRHHTSRG
jgi:hypothetical protein